MKQQVEGKIFLADERSLSETDRFQSWNTFNFGSFYQEHKKSFGNMYVLNDDTLAGRHSIKMEADQDSFIFLLPLAGAINYKDSLQNKSLIVAGQAQVFFLKNTDTFEIENPFKEDCVNFLQIWIKASKNTEFISPTLRTYKDVNKNINNLVKIFSQSDIPVAAAIGKFSGRGETLVPLKCNSGAFIFVIAGAFEAEGRLLHARDGLALWNTGTIEIEALSNDAILLAVFF